MKKAVAAALCLLLCPLLLGAVTAPILPTTDYYVNDAAGIISDDHKSAMLRVSQGLAESQAFQLVVLTVPSLEGMGYTDINLFADDIFLSWEIGGRQEENGALIVIVKEPANGAIRVGKPLAQEITPSQAYAAVEEILPTMQRGNASKATMDLYQALVVHLYDIWGLELPQGETPEAAPSRSYTMYAIVAIAIIAVARSFRVSRKYQRRYGKGFTRPRRHYGTEARDDEMREIAPVPDYYEAVGKESTADRQEEDR